MNIDEPRLGASLHGTDYVTAPIAYLSFTVGITRSGSIQRTGTNGTTISILRKNWNPLLCESRQGYQNLCQLITKFKMREITKGDGAATFDNLSEYAAGLVCLTGGDEGPLAAALAHSGESAGRETVEQLIRIFGRENVYVELQRHQEREEEWRNQAAIRIARSLGLPVVATNGVRYATAYDREIQDLFTAIRNHVELDQAGRLLAINSRRHIRTALEMAALWECAAHGSA